MAEPLFTKASQQVPFQKTLTTASSPSLPLPTSDNIVAWDIRSSFALFFDPSALAALPSVVLIFLALPRIYSLHKQDIKTTPHPSRILKLSLSIALASVEVTSLIIWILCSPSQTAASISIGVFRVLAAVLIVVLSQYEHNRSVRPSSILIVYLLCFPLDIIAARNIYLQGARLPIASVLSATAGVKFALWLVETGEKQSYLKAKYQNLPPESVSGIISRSFLWWLNLLFAEGSRKVLQVQNLFALDDDLAAENLGANLQNAWDIRAKPEGRFAFIRALCRSLGPAYAEVIFPRLCLIVFTFAQPFLITQVLEFLKTEDDEGSRQKGYYLVAATGLIYLGIAVSSLHSNHNLFRFITMFRGAAVSLVYNCTLSIQEGECDESEAVTLMSTDVDRISFCLEELNECWSRLIEIGIGIPLLTRQLGWVSVIPLVVCVLSTAGSSVITSIIGDRQRVWVDATQRRVAITGSTLNQMKSVRMMGLEGVMTDILKDQRVKETKLSEKFAWVMVWTNVIANIPMVLCPAATFAVYAIQATLRGSESLDTTKAFTSLALIMLVSHPCSRLLCAVPNTAASIGCFDRIQKFLLAKSNNDQRILVQNTENRTKANGYGQVDVPQGSDSEDAIDNKTCNLGQDTMILLEDVTVRFRDARPVLNGVNLRIQKGTLTIITGVIGTGKTTLLKAILGAIECEQGRVLVGTKRMAYCSQTPWLPNGTIRQAICGYHEHQSIDETWYKTVIKACALDYDISTLPNGDQTVYGSRGVTLSGGQKQRVALARALYFRPEVFILDDIFSGLDKRTAKAVVDHLCKSGGLFEKLGSTVVLATHAIGYLSLADQVVITDNGGKLHHGTYEEMKQAGLISIDIIDETVSSEIPSEKKVEDLESRLSEIMANDEEQDLTRQTGDLTVYSYYFKSVGFWKMLIFVFFCFLNVFSSSFSHIWLKWWTEIGGRQIGLYISVYFVLAAGYILGFGGYAWAISVVIGPSTGRSLHQVLLNTVMRAPQSFFTETEVGTILNRFSQDMSLIEGQLSFGVLATVSNLFSSLAEAALVATGSYYMIISIPFIMLAVYFIQRVYLRTSRQLRFLDLETRSPVYSHFLETLEGIVTIRAFGWQQEAAEENIRRLDNSQKPYYLLYCIQRWLALALDLMSAGMAIIVVALATSLRHTTSPGFLGVSMNNVLSFNLSVSAFVSGWTVLETSLGAIARLRDFEAHTKVEAKEGEDTEPPIDWPSKGLLEIERVTAAYNSSSAALQDISMTILPGQNVGICGRTGSGKSTLFSVLLRLLDLSSGTIKIDSLDLSTLHRTSIRRHLTAIPQDPLHLIGTVRLNIDPFSIATDSEIIAALERVGLWSILSSRGGLTAEIVPDSLSKGQQQLLALARALLHKSKIVLLDEATSSVDKETEETLRKVMKEDFSDCTIISIAHRLETIMDYDVVAVMNKGRMVEFGRPAELMADEKSAFSLLWKGAGDVSLE